MAENGLCVRDVVIAGIGEEVSIAHLSDIYLNYCNSRDFDEAESENRVWCANAGGHEVLRKMAGSDNYDDVTKAVYKLITENADVVKGFLRDITITIYILKLWRKTHDGKETVIPEFINTALAYDEGHVMRKVLK